MSTSKYNTMTAIDTPAGAPSEGTKPEGTTSEGTTSEGTTSEGTTKVQHRQKHYLQNRPSLVNRTHMTVP